jgi:hypothetical protein
MQMQNRSIRLHTQTVARLRTLAHLESLRLGREIHWTALVRQCVEKHLVPEMDAADPRLAAVA